MADETMIFLFSITAAKKNYLMNGQPESNNCKYWVNVPPETGWICIWICICSLQYKVFIEPQQ